MNCGPSWRNENVYRISQYTIGKKETEAQRKLEMEQKDDDRIKAQCKEMEDAYNLEIQKKETKRQIEFERKETILKDFEEAHRLRNQNHNRKGKGNKNLQEEEEKKQKENQKDDKLLFKGEKEELMTIKDIMNSKYMTIKAHLIRLKVYYIYIYIYIHIYIYRQKENN